MGWWTVTSLVPSGNVASTCTSGIISGTPSMTSARDKQFRAEAHQLGYGATITGALQDGRADVRDRLRIVELQTARLAAFGEQPRREDEELVLFARRELHAGPCVEHSCDERAVKPSGQPNPRRARGRARKRSGEARPRPARTRRARARCRHPNSGRRSRPAFGRRKKARVWSGNRRPRGARDRGRNALTAANERAEHRVAAEAPRGAAHGLLCVEARAFDPQRALALPKLEGLLEPAGREVISVRRRGRGTRYPNRRTEPPVRARRASPCVPERPRRRSSPGAATRASRPLSRAAVGSVARRAQHCDKNLVAAGVVISACAPAPTSTWTCSSSPWTTPPGG